MPEQIYIGNFAKGLKLDRLPFNIDNDAFPTMYNFYSWRGRAKRKRGTLFLGQLEIQVQSVLNATPPAIWQFGQIGLVAGAGNLFGTFITNITQAAQAVVTITGSIFRVGDTVNISGVLGMTEINGGPYTILAISPTSMTLNVNSTGFTPYSSGGTAILSGGVSIVPGSISVTVGVNLYEEPIPPDGTLIGTPGGTGTINYATGAITIAGGGAGPLIGTFDYFPGLPVMGLKDFVSTLSSSQYPLLMAFDTEHAYQINQNTGSVFFYNVSYYKGTNIPFIWHGQDYQQFWTTNFSGALWATNNVPGFNFLSIDSIVWVSATQLTIVVLGTAGSPPVIIGDKIWTNEITTNSTVNATAKLASVNGQTGTVANVVEAPAGTFTLTVNFPDSTIIDPATGDAGKVYDNGIMQLLTNSISGQDGIKWYDGDPTAGTGLPTGSGLGWVNFAPPLTAISVSINDTPSQLYYLVGALAIVPFKDRLLFFSPYIQSTTRATGGLLPIQLQDVVIWSWNGTPYYESVVPAGETFDKTAYYVDQTGKGGWIAAGISQPIVTVSNNEDVLLVGFGGNIGRQTRFVYSGDDINPFLFFNINQELGSSATFSAIALDRGALTIGSHGIALTTQQGAQRIDLDIPDSIFTIQGLNNGVERINAVRDYYKEWVYFSYPVNSSQWKFPTQTFLYNYREDTWAIFYENFTAHGTYRKQSHYSWATLPFKTWAQWREPWNAGSTSALFPDVVAGNPQGYVLIVGQGTGEGRSGTIQAIANSSGNTQITSVNHCVARNDYLLVQGALGILTSNITGISKGIQAVISTINTFSVGQFVTISDVLGMTELNGNSYQIVAVTGTSITINVDSVNFTTYISGGLVEFTWNLQIGLVTNIIDENNFVIDLPFPAGTYLGLGQYVRLSQPLIQTKQFPVYWDQGRQVRLCAQKYLMDKTANAQVTVNIYLSQDPSDIWNYGSIVPTSDPDPDNNSLIYSQIMYTCPESTNIGLSAANTNLQMPISLYNQKQIWHRFNTSLIGDTFQIGITLSDDSPGKKDAQMRNLTYATSEITLHGMHLTVDKGPQLA